MSVILRQLQPRGPYCNTFQGPNCCRVVKSQRVCHCHSQPLQSNSCNHYGTIVFWARLARKYQAPAYYDMPTITAVKVLQYSLSPHDSSQHVRQASIVSAVSQTGVCLKRFFCQWLSSSKNLHEAKYWEGCHAEVLLKCTSI